MEPGGSGGKGTLLAAGTGTREVESSFFQMECSSSATVVYVLLNGAEE